MSRKQPREEYYRVETAKGSQLMGSLMVDGVRVSARLLAQRAQADTVGLDALLEKPPTGGRRQRGGGYGAQYLAPVVAFSKRAAGYAARGALATAGWMATTGAPLAPKLKAAFGETGAAGQTVADTTVKLIALAIGLFRAIIGTSGRIVGNLGTAAATAEAALISSDNQQFVADTISRDAPTAIAVAVLALTQAGIVSLSTVVALVLRAIGAGLTGTGRAVATVAFYVWYVQQTKTEQEKIKTAANEAVKELRTKTEGAGKAARPRVAALASLIKEGVKKALEKVQGTENAGGGLIAGGSAAAGGVDDAAVVASVAQAGNEMAAGGADAVDAEAGAAAVVLAAAAGKEEEVGVNGAPAAAIVNEAMAAEADAAAADAAAVGEGDGAASSSSSSSSSASAAAAAASAAPLLPVKEGKWQSRVKKVTRKAAVASPEEEGDGAAAPARGALDGAEVHGEGEGKKLRRGGRKTKKGKSKRRVTRRRKAPKYLAAPVFVY